VRLTLIFHIIAGSLSLLAGYVALYATKGAPVHRRAGSVFVHVILAMTGSGLLISAVRGVAPAVNIPAALITAYLVITGLTTLRPPATGSRRLQLVAMLVAFTVGLFSLSFGLEAISNGGTRHGIPAFPFFMFGVIGVLGGVGDFRLLRSDGIQGRARLARHLWRMCVALLIAALSFFLVRRTRSRSRSASRRCSRFRCW
jgi:uncharacterized membrane protein